MKFQATSLFALGQNDAETDIVVMICGIRVRAAFWRTDEQFFEAARPGTAANGALAGFILLTLPQVAIGQDADEFTYWLEIDCSRSGFSNEGTRSDYMITGTSDVGVDYAFNYEEPDAQRLTDRNCVSGVAPFKISFPERVSLRHIRIELLEGRG